LLSLPRIPGNRLVVHQDEHLLSAVDDIEVVGRAFKSLRAFDMTIRKQPNGKWLCECYPNGRDGKRVRKQFATKGRGCSIRKLHHG
jgi:hypothetical protein